MHHQLLCSKDEKEEFGNALVDVITNRETVIIDDLKAQTGSHRMGYEHVMGCFNDGNMNEGGEKLTDL
jgi:hypothetical protein